MNEFGATASDLLIIIPCLNEAEHIARVLHTVQSDAACVGVLIVVADDNSADQTAAIAHDMSISDPRIKVLRSERTLGVSANVNRAVRAFAGDRKWLIRMDAHSDYPPGYVSKLLQVAEATGATSVVTPLKTQGSECFQKAAAAAQNSFLGTGGAAHRLAGRGGWVEHGHHALMRLDVFQMIGGYDESFTHNEDAELDFRITKSGGKIWLAADLGLTYFPRKTALSLFRQYFFYGRGRAMTVSRHGWSGRLRQMAPLAIAPAVVLILAAPISAPAVVPAMSWAVLCILAGLMIGSRLGRCELGAGFAAMIMHLAWSTGYWFYLLSRAKLGAPPKSFNDQTSEFAS